MISFAPSVTYTYPFNTHSLSEVRVVVAEMLPLKVVDDGTFIGVTSPPKSFEHPKIVKLANNTNNFFLGCNLVLVKLLFRCLF